MQGEGEIDTAAADAVDKMLGECNGVPFHPGIDQVPSPAAAVVDASEYYARLFTGPDFYCALWVEHSEGDRDG